MPSGADGDIWVLSLPTHQAAGGFGYGTRGLLKDGVSGPPWTVPGSSCSTRTSDEDRIDDQLSGWDGRRSRRPITAPHPR
jgi:hypothetical protein